MFEKIFCNKRLFTTINNSLKNKLREGWGVLDLLLSLGIGSGLVLGILAMFNSASTNTTSATIASDFNAIQSNVHMAYPTQEYPSSISLGALYTAGEIPSDINSSGQGSGLSTWTVTGEGSEFMISATFSGTNGEQLCMQTQQQLQAGGNWQTPPTCSGTSISAMSN